MGRFTTPPLRIGTDGWVRVSAKVALVCTVTRTLLEVDQVVPLPWIAWKAMARPSNAGSYGMLIEALAAPCAFR